MTSKALVLLCLFFPFQVFSAALFSVSRFSPHPTLSLSFSLPPPPTPYTVYSWFALWPREWGRRLLLLSRWQRGFPTSFSFSSGWIKTLCVAAGDVMAQKLLKAASLGNPISGSPDNFFPLLDCYSRAAWKRLWGFWLGSHTLLVEMANANPLNSNNGAQPLDYPVFFSMLCFRINRWFFTEETRQKQILRCGWSPKH